MFAPDGSLAGTGYAGGDCGERPDAIDNPECENLPSIGPLPEGNYTFGELVLHHPHLGPYCFPLIPDSDNKMYGRGGFWCHADTSIPGHASEGCIVQPYRTRVNMYQSLDHRLQVVASLGLTTTMATDGP